MNDDQQQAAVPSQPQQVGTVIQPATDFHILREADEVVGAEARPPGGAPSTPTEGVFPVMGSQPPSAPAQSVPAAPVGSGPNAQPGTQPTPPAAPAAATTFQPAPLDPVRDSSIGGLPITDLQPTAGPAAPQMPLRPEELLAPEFLAELDAAERAAAQQRIAQNPYPPQSPGGMGGGLPPAPPQAY